MHREVLDWLVKVVPLVPGKGRVCELGARDVNGSARPLFPDASLYVGVDLLPGPGVDVVADAGEWNLGPAILFDVVVATEMLEHAPAPERVCQNVARLLRPGGVLLLTAATGDRVPHSGVDGGELREGEWYANVSEASVRGWLADFAAVMTWTRANVDLYVLAMR